MKKHRQRLTEIHEDKQMQKQTQKNTGKQTQIRNREGDTKTETNR